MAAFRTFASIREVEEDIAVEAEACAQVLELTQERRLDRPGRVHGRNRRRREDDGKPCCHWTMCARSNPDLARGPDGPPPKGMFFFYDRELPTSDEANLGIENLPRELCSVLVYGKETDRAARLNIIIAQDDQFAEVLEKVGLSAGVSVAPEPGRVVTRMHSIQHLLRPRFWVPETTSMQQMQTYQEAWHQHQIQHAWPDLKLAFLDGKTPREAAKERRLKRKVLASILNMEMSFEQQPFAVDFNKLRSELGLPEAAVIDPEGIEIRKLSPAQVARLELSKVAPKDLARLFETVSVRPNGKTLHRIGLEILARADDMAEHIDFVEVRARLAETAPTSDESLEHLAAARDLAVADGESPASWLIAELDHRIQRQELDVAQRLITEIQTRYIREPGVAQMFTQVLEKYGLMPAAPGGSPAAAASQTPIPAEVGATGPTSDPAPGVWTPDAPVAASPAPTDGGEKTGESKIWMPGMD